MEEDVLRFIMAGESLEDREKIYNQISDAEKENKETFYVFYSKGFYSLNPIPNLIGTKKAITEKKLLKILTPPIMKVHSNITRYKFKNCYVSQKLKKINILVNLSEDITQAIHNHAFLS